MSTVVCIASGPSLTEQDVLYCKGRAETIAVNNNYIFGLDWLDHWYAADKAFWTVYKDDIPKFKGQKWIPIEKEFAKKMGLQWIPAERKPGLGKNGILHLGGHSGYQAINLAYHLGAKKIILLGYDMKVQGKKNHWFGKHPESLRNQFNYEKWRKNYKFLAMDLEKEGVDVVNCSRSTAITYFRQGKLTEELK